MKKLILGLAVLAALAFVAFGETDYTLSREVFLLKARVAALEAVKAVGLTTNMIVTNLNTLTFTDGTLTSASPY